MNFMNEANILNDLFHFKDQEDSRAETESEGTPKESKVRVVAASGDHIIAVANPALALSRTLLPKRECGSSLEDN